MSVSLHNLIENYNVLENPTNHLKGYFKEHLSLYKTALFVNHLFRTASMIGLQIALPFSHLANLGICFVGSLFYRVTVENNCAYKFALPAFAGSVAFPLALRGLINLVSGAAFSSLRTLAIATASLIPLTAYLVYIALTVNYDVDQQRPKTTK